MKAPILFLLFLGLASCGPLDKPPQGAGPEEEEEEPQIQRKYIGQIASVHADQNFVLIRRSPGVSVPAGKILISSGPGGSLANLRVSGETLGQMMAADIQSGSPRVGDSVAEPLLKRRKPEIETSFDGPLPSP
ncbi:MAG: hypothetical protein R3242_07690 [Akkermansiaceae bacterium]|nr:hypothetical protein [Akkermansiaceae bacterium]